MVIQTASGVQKALSVYNKQRFYAERAAQIKMPKTVQVGVEETITISSEAVSKLTASKSALTSHIMPKAITYEDPRIKTRRLLQEKSPASRAKEAKIIKDGGPVNAAKPAIAAYSFSEL